MKEQIAAAEMAGSVLPGRDSRSRWRRSTSLKWPSPRSKERLAAGKTDLAKFRDSVAQEGQLVAGDITRLEGELAEAEKGLPADFRDDYERVIRAKGADGMARMEDGDLRRLRQAGHAQSAEPSHAVEAGVLHGLRAAAVPRANGEAIALDGQRRQ